MSTSSRLERARHWSKKAGMIARGQYGEVARERKADNSLVTETDREIERFLRNRIIEQYPTDGIVGEEQDSRKTDSSFTWYLDPIDGTAAFSTRLHVWSVSMGIVRNGKPSAGVLYTPLLREQFYGPKDNGIHRNGERIQPATDYDWDNESLLLVPSDAHRRYEITFPGKCRCLGSTAYHMAMVAEGRAVGALLGNVRLWDMAGILGATSTESLCLIGIDGSRIDIGDFLEGDRCKQPAVFAPESTIDQLTERINSQ
ncbi:MAG: inositol monophosphatase family protein [bacterium]